MRKAELKWQSAISNQQSVTRFWRIKRFHAPHILLKAESRKPKANTKLLLIVSLPLIFLETSA